MTNESILKDADGIYNEFATPEKAAESVKLKVGMFGCSLSITPSVALRPHVCPIPLTKRHFVFIQVGFSHS